VRACGGGGWAQPSACHVVVWLQVRVVGETLPDTFVFTVDSTPPSTSLSCTLLPGAPITTASDNVTFTFVATDVSPTTQTCSITYAGKRQASRAQPKLCVLADGLFSTRMLWTGL
jgi:hypothetical protein